MQSPNEYPSAPVATAPSKPPRTVPFALFLATVAASLVIGVLVGVVTSMQLQPKPVNPQTYIKPLQEMEAYSRVVETDFAGLHTIYDAATVECYTADTTRCEADVRQVQDSITSFQSDLKRQNVPACMRNANTLLLTGLQRLHDADASFLTGITSNDLATVNKADADTAVALGLVEQAMSDYRAATC